MPTKRHKRDHSMLKSNEHLVILTIGSLVLIVLILVDMSPNVLRWYLRALYAS